MVVHLKAYLYTNYYSHQAISDFVVFNHSAMIYTIVGEIKCADDEAEQQNIEQISSDTILNYRSVSQLMCWALKW